jgi:hypothetical protein
MVKILNLGVFFMHKLRFYPIGNADCSLIELFNGRKIIIDYAHKRNADDPDDLRVDLPSKIREIVDDNVDVLAFTHADDDHLHGFSDLFYLEHAEKYQSDDRIKVDELWVPAAIILEDCLDDDARILRQEARYRLKNGKRIRVFSKPDKLKDWLKSEGINLEDRLDCITSAGNIVPGFSLPVDGMEIFIHSPFSETIDDKEIDRNNCCLIFQATFQKGATITKVIYGADGEYDLWNDIVDITKYRNRESRLFWDIFKISHHCSYSALNEDKGKKITVPTEQIQWLFDQGLPYGCLISSSWQIPLEETTQPPHFQSANYYKEISKKISGEFRVTMEYPSMTRPDTLLITIDENGATLSKKISGAAAVITSRPAPKAG